MNKRETIIIGGGASGLMCALSATSKGESVTILEADVKVGKKILVSGNGRCNFTNLNITPCCYNQNIDKFLNRFNPNCVVEYFNKLGLKSFMDEEQRMYPYSNLSSSVLDIILNQLSFYNTEILTQTKVESVTKNDNGYVVDTNRGTFFAKNVVLACGGNQSIKIVDSLNIKRKLFVPSLCALKTVERVKELSGIRLQNVKVVLNVDDMQFEDFGEVLFKDEGLSGICIMNLSAYLARQNKSTAKISIRLFPEHNKTEILNCLQNRKKDLQHLKASQFFIGMFHKNIGYELLQRAQIGLNESVKNFSNEQIENLTDVLTNFSFSINGVYANNQVFSGGVLLEELTNNLESKNNKNFYVCGEVCDVDGICGGYNLQWAWTSGMIVGESLNKND